MRRLIRILLFLAALGAVVFSSAQLLSYYRERETAENAAEQLWEEAVIRPTETPAAPAPAVDAAAPAEEAPVERAPFSVDFEALRAESESIVAWIYCEDSPINYPIVQGEDNQFYVERMPDGTWNGSGTLFVDCANAPDFSDFHSIVYGHNMLNDSMFGVLTDYYEQAFYDAHPCMYLLTPGGDYRMELVSGVVTPADSEDYNLDFTDPARKSAFLRSLRERSTFVTAAEYSEEDRFVTLSTCTYDFVNARYLLTGKLVPLG